MNLCCCSRGRRKLLKERPTAELKYDGYVLKQKRIVNVLSSSASIVGTCIVVSVAAAPATAGTSATLAAILAVGSALQILGVTCLEHQQLSEIQGEIEKRNRNKD